MAEGVVSSKSRGAMADRSQTMRMSSRLVSCSQAMALSGSVFFALFVFAPFVVGCSTGNGNAPANTAFSSPKTVLAAPPPKDDGSAAQGGSGGNAHSAAMEQLKIAKLTARVDRQNSLAIPLP